MPNDLKAAQRLLAEIQEATARAERQLARIQTQGRDHFAQNLAVAHESLTEDSLDRWTAHAVALRSA